MRHYSIEFTISGEITIEAESQCEADVRMTQLLTEGVTGAGAADVSVGIDSIDFYDDEDEEE